MLNFGELRKPGVSLNDEGIFVSRTESASEQVIDDGILYAATILRWNPGSLTPPGSKPKPNLIQARDFLSLQTVLTPVYDFLATSPHTPPHELVGMLELNISKYGRYSEARFVLNFLRLHLMEDEQLLNHRPSKHEVRYMFEHYLRNSYWSWFSFALAVRDHIDMGTQWQPLWGSIVQRDDNWKHPWVDVAKYDLMKAILSHPTLSEERFEQLIVGDSRVGYGINTLERQVANALTYTPNPNIHFIRWVTQLTGVSSVRQRFPNGDFMLRRLYCSEAGEGETWDVVATYPNELLDGMLACSFPE